MPAMKWSELKQELVEPEHSSAKGSIVRGQAIQVGLIFFPGGTKVKPHANEHEEIQTLIKGRAKYRVGKWEKTVGPGEAVLIRAHTEHSAEILEDLELLSFKDVGPGGSVEQKAVEDTPFFRWEEMESDFITPAYSSGKGPVVSGERIEVAFMHYPAGTGGKRHTHPNEQIQVPLKGKAKGNIGGEVSVTGPGDVVLIPANTEHEGQILEDYTVVNCKNSVPGWSVYHARWEK